MENNLISKGHKISFWGTDDYVVYIGDGWVETIGYSSVPIDECKVVTVIDEVLVKDNFINIKYSLN